MNKVLGMIAVSLFVMVSQAQAHCGSCGVGDGPKKSDSSMDASAMATEKADKWAKDLKLDDEQKGKLQAAIQQKLEKKQQIMDEKHKAMDALHEEFKTNLSGFLSADQLKQWEEMKDKSHCPMCKDGKMCDMCKKMKEMHCPDCKDGKMCENCKKMMKGHKQHKNHDHGHNH